MGAYIKVILETYYLYIPDIPVPSKLSVCNWVRELHEDGKVPFVFIYIYIYIKRSEYIHAIKYWYISLTGDYTENIKIYG